MLRATIVTYHHARSHYTKNDRVETSEEPQTWCIWAASSVLDCQPPDLLWEINESLLLNHLELDFLLLIAQFILNSHWKDKRKLDNIIQQPSLEAKVTVKYSLYFRWPCAQLKIDKALPNIRGQPEVFSIGGSKPLVLSSTKSRFLSSLAPETPQVQTQTD